MTKSRSFTRPVYPIAGSVHQFRSGGGKPHRLVSGHAPPVIGAIDRREGLMKKLVIAATATMLLPLGTASAAFADPPPWAPAHGKRAKDRWYADDHYRPGKHYKVRRLGPDDVIYRGRDGRYYCRRDDGTTGLVVGAIAGGVLGNTIAPGGSKTVGTVLGAVAGGLIGKEIDDGVECR
jgi:hypothetical protein